MKSQNSRRRSSTTRRPNRNTAALGAASGSAPASKPRRRERAVRRATANAATPVAAGDSTAATTSRPRPPLRCLRGYAFDPELSARLETGRMNEVVFRVPWEDLVAPGPIGGQVEVIDHDPASGCFYPPVDLDDPLWLAQDGLPPSEGDPRFHQQFAYAVVMTTIRNFERALGRPALWAPRKGRDGRRDAFVERLRVYPHALREANAYYSPEKCALLFGYFPATPSDPAAQLPGGTVFTCLSHDIVAHETAHALLDGMHRRFVENTHPDGLAFHEAFADIVALFQHFSFPEVLRHQIVRTRGDLASQSLLGQLAQQFGVAVGRRGALRDAIGEVDPGTGEWRPRGPDPDDYARILEPHARGALLVAAVFEAFLAIYRSRVADLFRIAGNGAGVPASGALHPDLVERLSAEAAKTARHVLTICVRALDYCPPVDVTFGEYLRAMITADAEMVPSDDRGYRLAFIEAFRRRGLYPRDVRSMSVESLRWQPFADRDSTAAPFASLLARLRGFLDDVSRSRVTRPQLFAASQRTRAALHTMIRGLPEDVLGLIERATGLVLRPGSVRVDRVGPDGRRRRETLDIALDGGWPRFEVHALWPARRANPDRDIRSEVVLSITQWRWAPLDPARPVRPGNRFPFRGGCTIVADVDTLELRYVVRKRINSFDREARQRRFLTGEAGASLRAAYFGVPFLDQEPEPFAVLHGGS
jgi:hypothetical protein